uniref:Uncharacterized protein n=1 Tax=Kalanchoe fedtschenkoi TaxID=63787 RepID=A0A7N0UXT3_KALFE
MTEPPKLFTHKPKKAQIKQSQGNVAKDINPTSASVLPPPPPPPPSSSTPPPSHLVKESFARRYKFLWPLLLTVNLSVGAYIFMRTKKKNTSGEEETTSVAASATDTAAEKTVPTVAVTTSPVSAQASAVSAQTASSPAITAPQTAYRIVPEEQQRELFKWILDEKRKIKPKDAEEKKRIDAEKAVLKQFIRAESIPIF